MAFDLIRVCLLGRVDSAWNERVRLPQMAEYEASGFDIFAFADDADLTRILTEIRPQVIVTLGDPQRYPRLWDTPLEVRKRWVSVENADEDPEVIADRIMSTFIANATEERFPEQPLVSVFTPTHKTGAMIERPFRSLLAQHYPNWEWVIVDDSPDGGRTFAELSALAQRDHRIAVHRADQPSGCIGEVKRRACGLARGAILVELAHDDELTPNALGDVVEGSRRFPDAGFFYTDCAEVFDNGETAMYGEGWGLGFGSYRQETLNGRGYMVANYPDVNAKTMRHIVGVPNHVRAWTREAYHAAGGHSPELHVCDDYELLIRTFLTTRMVHIQRFGYIQYHNRSSSGNAHRQRNKEIQRLVKYFRGHYNERIHQRFLALGVDDYIWRDGGWLDWDTPDPKPTPIANYQMP
jgi:glycosyltransferase involved in cell wall biosynthesis